MTRRSLIALLCAAFATTIMSCGGSGAGDGQTFTLYRNSVTDENMRIHVSTFNAADGEAYNRENCEQAQLLFKAQPGVKTKCERFMDCKIKCLASSSRQPFQSHGDLVCALLKSKFMSPN